MKPLLLTHLIFFGLFLSAQPFTEYATGSNTDLVSTASGGICLMGGASENDNASRWFLQRANGGDVVVLRTSGSDGYNNYFYSQLGVTINSVTTFVCHNRLSSSAPVLLSHIANAEAIWFAGGDQWDYISFWQDSPLDSLIRHKIENENLVIGGTSAGMAILGHARFSAQTGTVTSSQVLANPFHPNAQIDTNTFITPSVLENVITDTHYDNPNRQGRHLGFMARLMTDFGWSEVKGIACDEYTAVCIDTNGVAQVFGDYPTYDDNAYFLQSNCQLPIPQPETCTSGQPLTWSHSNQAVWVYEVKGTSNGSNTFELNDWSSGVGGQWKYWHVQNGVMSSSPANAPVCSSFGLNENIHSASIYFDIQSQKLNINFPSIPAQSVQLISLSGKIIAENDAIGTLDFNWHLPFVESGLYLVRLQYAEGNSHQKILIP